MLSYFNLSFGADAVDGPKTIGDIVQSFLNGGYLNGIYNLIFAVCYLAGVFFGIKAVLMLKDKTDGEKTKPHQIAACIIACGIFMALPDYLNVGISSVGFSADKDNPINKDTVVVGKF